MEKLFKDLGETLYFVVLNMLDITDCKRKKFLKMKQDKPSTEEEVQSYLFNLLKTSGTISVSFTQTIHKAYLIIIKSIYIRTKAH